MPDPAGRRGGTGHDVTVVGLGPAGRALAHRLLAQGARVLAVDPHPDRPWRPTYGGWEHQLPGWLDRRVVGASAGRVDLVAHRRHRLDGRYVVLDNDALQAALDITGATVRTEYLDPDELAALPGVVVDCRGNTRALQEDAPVQSAHGLKLDAAVAAPLLDGSDAVLMDWRPHDGSASWAGRPPSFCYVVPLPDGRVLAEETSLAARPAVERQVLAARLSARLQRHGIGLAATRDAEVEAVHIAMLPPSCEVPAAFGAAGDQLNEISGYSVFAALAAADDAARHLLDRGLLPRSRAPWRRTALGAVLQLDGDATVDLFDAFGRLPAAAQRAVLDPAAPQPWLLAALARQAALMPPGGRRDLVVATARGVAADVRERVSNRTGDAPEGEA